MTLNHGIRKNPGIVRRWTVLLAFTLPACAGAANAAHDLPREWDRALNAVGTRSFTSAGRPGDPLNIAVVASEDELLRIMANAHWDPADPITVRSSLRIAIDSVARRHYADAPVSSLYINGKKQDLAFEQAVVSPSKRHHVRFWRADPPDSAGRSLWVGAATYDSSVGISHTNGHITHHIAAEVDKERDKLRQDIQAAGPVAVRWVDNFQPARQGRNGAGDPFLTDGRLVLLAVEGAH